MRTESDPAEADRSSSKEGSMKMRVFTIVLAWSAGVSAATFTVTTTADTGSGSLRQAILGANSRSGPDTIGFDIPETGMTFNGQCWFIEPFTDLPALTDSGTVIDGASQTIRHGNLNANGPEIYLFGYQGRNGYTVWDGIRIESSRNVVRNLIVSCFGGSGIVISGPEGRFNRIEGNFVGTNFSGQDTIDSPNYSGITLTDGAARNTIGGVFAGDGNVISGNRSIGLVIHSSDSNRVVGNRIGTDVTGARAVGNKDAGIYLSMAAGNEVGGTQEGEGNLISGNAIHGVWIDGAGSTENRVVCNRIGTNAAGTAVLPNGSAGVAVHHGAKRNRIGPGNDIRGNANWGVVIYLPETAQNTVTRNAISENGRAGITIANHANGDIHEPVVERTADGIAGSTVPNAVVEVFSDRSDQGAIYEGTVAADASGNFTWSGTPAGPKVTATVTDAEGNTSAFSNPLDATDVEDGPAGTPVRCRLSAVFPNPFNASTVVRFDVPAACRVRLDVFDGQGRRVRTLADGVRPAGEWTVRFDASGLPSGAYLVRMEAGGFTASRKIAVVK
jgi:hypothetical protein